MIKGDDIKCSTGQVQKRDEMDSFSRHYRTVKPACPTLCDTLWQLPANMRSVGVGTGGNQVDKTHQIPRREEFPTPAIGSPILDSWETQRYSEVDVICHSEKASSEKVEKLLHRHGYILVPRFLGAQEPTVRKNLSVVSPLNRGPETSTSRGG